MGHSPHKFPEIIVGQFQLGHIPRAVLDNETFNLAAPELIFLLQHLIVPVIEFLPGSDLASLFLGRETEPLRHMAHIIVLIFGKIHTVIDDIQQIQATLGILDDMGVMLHIHALKDKGHLVFTDILFQYLQIFGGYLFIYHILKPPGVLAVDGGLAGDQQLVLIFVVTDDPQKAVFLHIGSDRKLQLVLQHVKFGLRALVDIEKLVVCPGRHFSLQGVQIQPSRLGGLFVPHLVIERFTGKIK